MANGQTLAVYKKQYPEGCVQLAFALDAQGAAAAGVYIEMLGAKKVTAHISGLGTGGVTPYGHAPSTFDGGEPVAPTDSDDHEAIGSEITSGAVWTLSHPDVPWFLKFDKTTEGDATETTVLLVIEY